MSPSSSAVANTPARCCITTRTVLGARPSVEMKACTSPFRIEAIGRSPKCSTAYRSRSSAVLRVRGRHTPLADDVTVVWRSQPFCHCAFTARPGLPAEVADRFVELLTSMDPEEPAVAEIMRLEHLTRWLPATDDGWTGVIDAIRTGELEGATFI